MPLYLFRMLNKLKHRVSWGLPVELLLFVYFTSWPLMALAEGGKPIVQPDVYWWWFVVTAATVGYGDFHPETVGGRLVGIYVIVGGVVIITTLFARVAQMIDNAKGLRMKGQQELRLSSHVTILGYTPGRTERIIDRLTAEDHHEIVICAWEDQTEEHPMAHREDVHFVRGNLTDDDVLRRAGLARAAAVLVDGRDDDEALKVTVAANYASAEVHTVVALQDLAHSRTVAKVAENAYCVQWHAVEVITEELQDIGMSRVYAELMNHSDRNTYSLVVPDTLPQRTFGEFQQALGRWNAATVVAMKIGEELHLSPSWNAEVPVGTVLFYIAKRRLQVPDLERYVDRAERMIVSSERELLRSEWH